VIPPFLIEANQYISSLIVITPDAPNKSRRTWLRLWHVCLSVWLVVLTAEI